MGNIVATTWDVFGCNFPHFSTNTGRKGGSPQSLNYVIVQTNVVICGMDLFENGIYIYTLSQWIIKDAHHCLLKIAIWGAHIIESAGENQLQSCAGDNVISCMSNGVPTYRYNTHENPT